MYSETIGKKRINLQDYYKKDIRYDNTDEDGSGNGIEILHKNNNEEERLLLKIVDVFVATRSPKPEARSGC